MNGMLQSKWSSPKGCSHKFEKLTNVQAISYFFIIIGYEKEEYLVCTKCGYRLK